MKASIALLALLCAQSEARRGAASATTTTTTAASATDTTTTSYATQVKALIDAGTCADITTSSNCEADADSESHYEEFTYNGYRVIVTSGSPNHASETELFLSTGALNPNRRCSRWQYAQLALEPQQRAGTYTSSGLGTVGYATSGGVFYNHLSNFDGSLALYNELDTLDVCMGHSDQDKQYHYHGIPFCMPNDLYYANDTSQCYHVGYMLDGFPIYGRCYHSGTTTELQSCWVLTDGENGDNISDYYYDTAAYGSTCYLDEVNGYTFSDGSYGYVLTTNFATTPIGYKGTSVATTCGFTP